MKEKSKRMQADVEVRQWHNWQLCDKDREECDRVCVCFRHSCMYYGGYLGDIAHTHWCDGPNTDTHKYTHKVSHPIPGNECDFYWRLLTLRHQSADDMWWLMGDGCCHLAVCLLGWREGGRGSEWELSRQSSENAKQRKQNVRFGNCEQTAERVHGGVRVS